MDKIMSKKLIIIAAAVAAVIAVIVGAIFIIPAVTRTTIDLEDYVIYEYDGYDGYGYVNWDVDWDSIDMQTDREKFRKFVQKLGEDATYEERLGLMFAEDITDFVDINISQSSDLSNGDEVVIGLELSKSAAAFGLDLKDIEKGFGVKFKNTEIKFKIEDLPEPLLMSFRDDASNFVVFEGPSGKARVKVEIPADYAGEYLVGDGLFFQRGYRSDEINITCNDQVIGKVVFDVTDEDGNSVGYLNDVENGQKFKLTVDVQGYDYEQYGVIIPEETIDITASGIGELVTSEDELDDDLINKIIAATKEQYAFISLEEVYFSTAKPTAVFASYPNNIALVVYKSESSGSWYYYEGYMIVRVVPMVHENGEVEILEIKDSSFYDTMEEVHNDMTDDATYVNVRVE